MPSTIEPGEFKRMCAIDRLTDAYDRGEAQPGQVQSCLGHVLMEGCMGEFKLDTDGIIEQVEGICEELPY